MRKFLSLVALVVLVSFGKVYADEGMWLPMFVERLNYVDMQKAGLQLTPEEIYSVNHSSLKDAIVGLSGSPTPSGFFCTGEIVSDKGLLFTNHHCGYDNIQKLSSVEHDYLANGFWAKSFDEELPTNGEMTASFLIRMEDVTDSVFAKVTPEMSEQDRRAEIRKVIGRLSAANSENGKYNVVIKSFYEGNEYYMFVYQVYTDVRLVGTPPSAVGKFGGDTDNWMWPRHTGDFSIFRVYCAPDGSPANYSEENVPLTPKHHLPISLDGIEKGDFTMIWGFPGSTDRYLSSFGVDFNLEAQFPTIIEIFGKRLEVWKESMRADQKVRIQYASKSAGVANTWKYLIGQSRGLKNLKVADKKRELEAQFTKWVNADPARQEEYGKVLETFESSYNAAKSTIGPILYMQLAGLNPEIVSMSMNYQGLQEALTPIDKKDLPKDKKMAATMKSQKEEQLKAMIEQLRNGLNETYKDYDAATDKKVLAELTKIYIENVPVESQSEYIVKTLKKFKNDYNAYADYIFENSMFDSKAEVEAFLANPSLKKLENDPANIISSSVMAGAMAYAIPYQTSQTPLAKANRLYMKGLREMQADKVFYPNANSTMRMTYGSVQDYQAADAVHYDFVTTSKGILEKEDPTNDEFIVPAYLKELIEKKDFGVYGVDGELIVCFLSTNDITGGNSGSPIINGKGELIGLAFDGNWEAMSGDIAFEPELQRTINVDIRYVLFIIDKYAGATNLIDEMTIHKATPAPLRVEYETNKTDI